MPNLEDLAQELLCHVLRCGLEVEDILHLCRVSKRLLALVNSCSDVWQHFYIQKFEACSLPVGVNSWQTAFKLRYIRQRQAEKLKQKVKGMKLQSALQDTFQRLRLLQANLQQEYNLQNELLADLEQLRRNRQAHTASMVWQPIAIQRHYNRLLDQTPVQPEYAEQQLTLNLKTCQQQITCLLNSKRVLEQQHKSLERRLNVMQA